MPKTPDSVRRLEAQTARPAPPATNKPEDRLRALAFHGVEFSDRGTTEVSGNCVFCGKDNKLYAQVDTGLWSCKVCGRQGNPLTFVRQYWEHCSGVPANTQRVSDLVKERGFLSEDSVAAWGICRSVTAGGNWLVPGYGADGALDQLYRWTPIRDDDGKWRKRLLPTPGLWPDGRVHQFHAVVSELDWEKPGIIFCEGWSDGVALWEVYRPDDYQLVALPGCNVFRDEWLAKCRGKDVILPFDSDHPKTNTAGTVTVAGYQAVQRLCKKLSGVARSIKYVAWGENGYDLSLSDGYDMRDHIRIGGNDVTARFNQVSTLFVNKLADPADEWFRPAINAANNGVHVGNGKATAKWVSELEPRPCNNWPKLEAAWKDAMLWRESMSDAIAAMLAVCASTPQGGSQLFLDIVGSAGSGKTTMCDGLLVSRHCHHLEHLSGVGFHSGFKMTGEKADKDCSLIARIGGKTMVTSEADVMISSPHYKEWMSQTRRIFDGKSGKTYGNSDEDMLLQGLRTPWIRAGTPVIMDTDQSRLGDRFMRYIIDEPRQDVKRDILRAAFDSQLVAMEEESNGTQASIENPKKRLAKELTGGYVDWLRANTAEAIRNIPIGESAREAIIDMAELTADLRARPNRDKSKEETHETKELPARLVEQFAKVARCLAVVTSTNQVGHHVMRIVRKLALSTAHGHSLSIAKWIGECCHPGTKRLHQDTGVGVGQLSLWASMTEERMLAYCLFLRKVGVLERVPNRSELWRLTDRSFQLYRRVCCHQSS